MVGALPASIYVLSILEIWCTINWIATYTLTVPSGKLSERIDVEKDDVNPIARTVIKISIAIRVTHCRKGEQRDIIVRVRA